MDQLTCTSHPLPRLIVQVPHLVPTFFLMFRSLPDHSINQAPNHLILRGSPCRFILLLPVCLFRLTFHSIGILDSAVEV